jgi:hypothetical protein
VATLNKQGESIMPHKKPASALLAVFLAIAGLAAFTTLPGEAQEAKNGLQSRTPRKLSDPMVGPSLMGPVPIGGPWIEFAFGATGSSASGCSPADPGGPGCAPSSGGNSSFGGAPPWTFTAPAGGATITVTDAFLRGDQFEVFDSGSSIGVTSTPANTGDCGDNPDPCLADPQVSHGVFSVGAGAHSITIKAKASPFGAGAAYFRIDVAKPNQDHFLCYEIKPEKEFKRRRVAVRDQFGGQNYIVIRPNLLCVPATKKHLD